MSVFEPVSLKQWASFKASVMIMDETEAALSRAQNSPKLMHTIILVNLIMH